MIVDTTHAQKRLEGMLTTLDRSIAILRGEHPGNGHFTYDRDPADAGATLTETERVGATLEVMERQRSEVLAALARLASGSYGSCSGCAGPVPEGRLEVRPEAARCVRCQAKYDKSHR